MNHYIEGKIRFMAKYWSSIVLISVSMNWAFSQSCCSGGVPLSNNIGMPGAESGTLQLRFSYDYNNLNTLRAEWSRLEDDSRKRLTRSYMLNWGLQLSGRWSVEGILPYIQQERIIDQGRGLDIAQASGMGDAIVLLNYTLLQSPDGTNAWRLALGTKMPLGAFDRTNELGLVYNAELQPGSGAWDLISWSQYQDGFRFRPSLSYSLTVAYSQKGTNRAYLGDQAYKFGNELQLSAALADRLFVGKALLDLGLALRYRRADTDQFNSGPLPATGGQWLFLEPSLAYWWTTDFSVQVSLSLPVMAYVQDTQFSPTIRYTFGAFYRLSLKKRNDFSI